MARCHPQNINAGVSGFGHDAFHVCAEGLQNRCLIRPLRNGAAHRPALEADPAAMQFLLDGLGIVAHQHRLGER